MAKNSQNVRIGQADLYIDFGAGEVSLGHTFGGVDFEFDRNMTDLLVDDYGSSPVEIALTGNDLRIVARLAEPVLEILQYVIPEGAYVEGVGGDAKMGLGQDSGYMLGQHAGELRIHPHHKADNERDEDIYIWKAVSVENITMPFRNDEQRVVEVTFRALVDETQPAGSRLGRIGDADIS